MKNGTCTVVVAGLGPEAALSVPRVSDVKLPAGIQPSTPWRPKEVPSITLSFRINPVLSAQAAHLSLLLLLLTELMGIYGNKL
jgi:hypothetical protein